MAEDKPLTPEKQLLKLIENPKGESLRAEDVKRQGKKWISLGALKGRLAFWKSFSFRKWISVKQLSRSSFGIRRVNLILKFSIVFLSLYLGYSVFVTAAEMKRASNLIFEHEKNLTAALEPGSPLKSLPYYLEKVGGRNLFSFTALPKEEPAEEGPVSEAQPEGKKARQLLLVGIAWSDDPEAMIEDTDAKQTYFVRRGQSIDDELKVVAIFKDAVILSVDGKEIELK